MMRLDDWERRLHEFLIANADRPFEWGQWDCILMACAGVAAMTTVDVAAPYRGKYSDAKGAALALREIGQGTLVKTVDHHFAPSKLGKARRGDLVQVGTSIGLCMGAHGLFVGEEQIAEAAGVTLREGLIAVPRAQFVRAWTV